MAHIKLKTLLNEVKKDKAKKKVLVLDKKKTPKKKAVKKKGK